MRYPTVTLQQLQPWHLTTISLNLQFLFSLPYWFPLMAFFFPLPHPLPGVIIDFAFRRA